MSEENKSLIVVPSGEPHIPTDSLTRSTELLGADSVRLFASVALVAAAALVEPELLAGALVGAGIAYGLPIAGRVLRAAAISALRFSYSAGDSVGEMLSQARQQLEGMVVKAVPGNQPPENKIRSDGPEN